MKKRLMKPWPLLKHRTDVYLTSLITDLWSNGGSSPPLKVFFVPVLQRLINKRLVIIKDPLVDSTLDSIFFIYGLFFFCFHQLCVSRKQGHIACQCQWMVHLLYDINVAASSDEWFVSLHFWIALWLWLWTQAWRFKGKYILKGLLFKRNRKSITFDKKKNPPVFEPTESFRMQWGCSTPTFVQLPKLLSPSETWCAAGLDIFQGQVDGCSPVGRWWGDVSNALQY